ncbi:YkgJ family cysteine cluster protein [Entomospira entomophila]|uniref:YkgJ family cysteine cluster protein n=1 Tax=Entomospira entomophila TaxID=2719988 RepID=A0A968G906_9SPIO|nr:YkgJ family cysteine cluster protein [Entomospira entomophilus]NIZ40147.1 YkgJ family cysteine cluster protein [Entomospira entomophilus]WDI35705.1 YkgJ family cysteine cluster protein [Entomospira entomophilus]
MKQFYKDGLQFQCTQCSHCCRGESGYVFLSKLDLDRLSKHLELSEGDFLEQHVRTIPFGDHLRVSLLEKPEPDGQFRCEFWNDGCSVYHARPTQCRTYPFWQSIMRSEQTWQEESKSCPGIGQKDGHFTQDEIDHLLDLSNPAHLIQLRIT